MPTDDEIRGALGPYAADLDNLPPGMVADARMIIVGRVQAAKRSAGRGAGPELSQLVPSYQMNEPITDYDLNWIRQAVDVLVRLNPPG